MNRPRALLLHATAAMLFSTAGLLIKVTTVSPMALAGARSVIASLVILAWVRRPRFVWSAAQLGGAATLTVTQVLFVVATRETTAANAIFIQYTAPVFVALFSAWFLGERPGRYDWATIGVVGVGLLFFFGEELSIRGTRGNVFALMSGITLAWMLLFLRKQRGESTAETFILGNLLTAAVGLPFLLGETPTAGDWGGILFLGAVQLGIPFILISVAIKYLTAVEAVLIQTLEPVFNPIWVFLAIGEAPTPLALVGGVIVLGAVTVRAVIAGRQAVEARG